MGPRLVKVPRFLVSSASKSLHSLHKVHVELQPLQRTLSSSEKQLSAPIYPDMDVNIDEKIAEEENNLLGGDVERLNGKVPTVSPVSSPFQIEAVHMPTLRHSVSRGLHYSRNQRAHTILKHLTHVSKRTHSSRLRSSNGIHQRNSDPSR